MSVGFAADDPTGQITIDVSFSEPTGASQAEVAEELDRPLDVPDPLLWVAGVLGRAGWEMLSEHGPFNRLSLWFRRTVQMSAALEN